MTNFVIATKFVSLYDLRGTHWCPTSRNLACTGIKLLYIALPLTYLEGYIWKDIPLRIYLKVPYWTFLSGALSTYKNIKPGLISNLTIVMLKSRKQTYLLYLKVRACLQFDVVFA